MAELVAANNANHTSAQVALFHLQPKFAARGGGVFLLTGGGLSRNGAWSVGMGLQFGAPVKSYVVPACMAALWQTCEIAPRACVCA